MIPRYSRPDMVAIWSPESKFRIWFEIEAHACDAQAKLGVIPESAAKAVWTAKDVEFDVDRIDEIEREVKHDVIAFLTHLAEHVGDEARFVHQGMTSSDVLDTCFNVQLVRAADILLDDMDDLCEALKAKAYEHKDTVCIGRSHGIHAEPVTFGLKMAQAYAEMDRNRSRLAMARAEVATCAISGAVGTFANIDPSVEAHVAEAMGLAGRAQMQERIDQSITKVLTRQSANGAFGLWSPGSGDFWLDAYVSDFLGRARAEGYVVPDIAFRSAMDNLRNRISYAPDFDSGGEDIAYALLVLAREGAASMGDLRYYADIKGDAFATPMAAAQLGGALAAYGDQTRADAMFARAARMIARRTAPEQPVWRVDYGTNLRDSAGVLALATEAGSQSVDTDALLDGRLTRCQDDADVPELVGTGAPIPEPPGCSATGAPVSDSAMMRPIW